MSVFHLYVGFDHLPPSDELINELCRHKEVLQKWKKIATKLQVDCKAFPKTFHNEIKLKRVCAVWKETQKLPFTMTTLLNVLRSKEVDASSVACQFGEYTVYPILILS